MEVISTFLIVVLLSLAIAVLTVAWIWHTLRLSEGDYQARFDKQDGEIDDLRQQIHELREGRIVDHALLQEWITYARRLAAMFKEATGQEPPAEPQTRVRPISPGDLARLARAIQSHFSLDEINNLGFELGVDGALSGETAEARARALVDVARKRGLIARLIALYREQRPNGGVDD